MPPRSDPTLDPDPARLLSRMEEEIALRGTWLSVAAINEMLEEIEAGIAW